MASTNKTANLGLPQWEAMDSVARTDMNSAFAKIDTAIHAAGDCNIKCELILDKELPAQNVTKLSIDLSGHDMSIYKALYLEVPAVRTCWMSFIKGSEKDATCEAADAFILFGTDNPYKLLRFNVNEITLRDGTCAISDIDGIYFSSININNTFNVPTHARLWGIRI